MITDKLYEIAIILASNGITYFFTRKKYLAETKATELSNFEEAFEIYQNLINDLNKRVELLTSKITNLELTIEQLKTENALLRLELAKKQKPQ